jgi:hypothetical protein
LTNYSFFCSPQAPRKSPPCLGLKKAFLAGHIFLTGLVLNLLFRGSNFSAKNEDKRDKETEGKDFLGREGLKNLFPAEYSRKMKDPTVWSALE